MTTSPLARLLIIEDNEEVLRSLKKYFTKKNYDVVTASNGLDGLKVYENDQDGFDLIITDLVMPNIGGVALISIFKKRLPDLPVIAITASKPDETAAPIVACIAIGIRTGQCD